MMDEEFGGLKSIWYQEQKMAPEFVLFANGRILPMLRLDGYKLKEKKCVAIQCIHNLSLTGLRVPSLAVRDNRDNSRNGLRIAVWDKLIEAGLCSVWQKGIQGIPNRVQGGVTRYRATKKLLDLLTQYDQKKYLDLRLDFNTKRKRPTFDAHVVVHTGRTDLDTGERLPQDEQKRLIPMSRFHPDIVYYLSTKEEANARYNAIMAKHEWLIAPPDSLAYEPNFLLKYTHSGRPFRYMRLTGWSAIGVGQVSKAERRHLLIDGEPATELDFGSFDIRRHYHFARIDVQGDAYKPEIVLPGFYRSKYARSRRAKGIVRKLVKTATNICLNCSTRSTAHSSIGKLLRKWSKKQRSFLWGIESEDAFLWRTLNEIEGLRHSPSIVKVLVRRILKAHPDIRHVFFDADRGSMMMTVGAAMMHTIRTRFAEEDKPVYCIHDAVVCRKSDRAFAKAVMLDVYHLWVRPEFDPIINVEF